MTYYWFALVTAISVLCSCNSHWMRLSLGDWRWSRSWSSFTSRGTRLRMQLLCCRTLWINSHRFEYITTVLRTSFTFSVCDHSLFCGTKYCWNFSKSRMKWDTWRSCCRLLKSRPSSLPPRFVQPWLLFHRQNLMFHCAQSAAPPWAAEEGLNSELSVSPCFSFVSSLPRLSPCRRSSTVPLWFAGASMSRTFSCSFLCSSSRPCWRRVPLASPSWRRFRLSCKHRFAKENKVEIKIHSETCDSLYFVINIRGG